MMTHKTNTQITMVNTEPGIDPYHLADGQSTTTVLRIWVNGGRNRDEWGCSVNQDMDQGAHDVDDWYGRTININLDDVFDDNPYAFSRPDPQSLRIFLEGERAQGLLARVCGGHSIEWDGNNMVGCTTQDANNAIDELLEAIKTEVKFFDYVLWSAERWFQNIDANGLGITKTTADDEIARIAASEDSFARDPRENDSVNIIDDINGYLTQMRDDLMGVTGDLK